MSYVLYEQSLNIILVLTEILYTFVLFKFMLILNTTKKNKQANEIFLNLGKNFCLSYPIWKEKY